MGKEDIKVQVRSKLFPVETIKVNGVPIEIRPLRHGLVCEAIDAFWGYLAKLGQGQLDREFLVEAAMTLNRYLNECVRVPDDPEMTVEDLPESAMPQIVEAFLLHTLKPGNWRTLAQSLQEKLGISLSQGR